MFLYITGPHCFCTSEEFRLSSVGKEMYGVETKIDKPDVDGNGEVGILFQLSYWGRHVFMGYINYFSYVTGVGIVHGLN